MKLYYAKVTVLNEGGEFVGIYTTYQKCYDALVATGYYGDKTYILEVEPDNEKPLRAWEMTNCSYDIDEIVPDFVPARDYDYAPPPLLFGKAEDYNDT